MGKATSLQDSIERHLAALARLGESAEAVERIAAAMERTLKADGRILTCGNGGSAAEALHLAEEMIGCFSKKRRPLAAVCLASDPAAMTCIANDFGYEELFARQVEGLGRKGDMLVALSTSGRSPNIVRALQRARSLQVTTVGLLGPAGSLAQEHCDLVLNANAADSAGVQEIHLVVTHLLLEYLDARF